MEFEMEDEREDVTDSPAKKFTSNSASLRTDATNKGVTF